VNLSSAAVKAGIAQDIGKPCALGLLDLPQDLTGCLLAEKRPTFAIYKMPILLFPMI
jgi:hypothetical protein